MTSTEITILIVLGFIVLCGIVALVTYLIVNKPESHKSIQRRIAQTNAAMQQDYFQAVGEIMQETARQRNSGGSRLNLNDILKVVTKDTYRH